MAVRAAGFSHGMGDSLWSAGAERGVGKVDAVAVVVTVAADFGVLSAAETGVKGVLARGESSGRVSREGGSRGALPDRSRLRDNWRISSEPVGVEVGITRGARFLGDMGGRGAFASRCSSSLLLCAGRSSGRPSNARGCPKVTLSVN